MRGARAPPERIKRLARLWGTVHHSCKPKAWVDRATCRTYYSFETLLVSLCLTATRSSLGMGVIAAGGSVFGNHIVVVQHRTVDCAVPSMMLQQRNAHQYRCEHYHTFAFRGSCVHASSTRVSVATHEISFNSRSADMGTSHRRAQIRPLSSS